MANIDVRSKELVGDVWRVDVSIDGQMHALRVRDDADLDAQVLAIIGAAARVVTLGPREIVEPKQKDPTQDEIDRAAFSVLIRDLRRMRAELDAGVGKTSQADLDAKTAEMKAAYKDEYAPLLVGAF